MTSIRPTGPDDAGPDAGQDEVAQRRAPVESSGGDEVGQECRPPGGEVSTRPPREPGRRTAGIRRLRNLGARLETTFAGRCAASFVGLQGIDRAMAIAAQAFTALIPLLILASALAPADQGSLVADAVVERFRLTGDAAHVVQQVFARPTDGSTGVFSVVLLLFSGVSFTRRVQRMYLQAWRLPPSTGARGSFTAALGLAALLLEIALLSFVTTIFRALPFGGDVLRWSLSILASFVLWTLVPWLLLDRRVPWRRLLPGGAIAATGAGVYGIASTIYMPRLMESYSRRYGLFGVTLSLIGWLLAIAVILVAATVVATEFDRADDAWARRLRVRLGIESPGAGRPERLGR
jgi:membrane protein